MDATSWGKGDVSRKSKKKSSIREHTGLLHVIKTSPPLPLLHRKCSHNIHPRQEGFASALLQTEREISPKNFLTKGNFQCLLTR